MWEAVAPVGSGQLVAGQHEQVGGQHRGVDVGPEAVGAPPGAAPQPEGAVEKRDRALDARPEGLEPLVDPAALDHVADLQAPLLVEGDVLDVGLRGEAAVEGRLLGPSAVQLGHLLQEPDSPGGVGRVAVGHHAVEDEPGGAAGEEHLVAELHRPLLLDDHVGMGLEDRKHLLGRRHPLALEHPADGLVDHPGHKPCEVAEFPRDPAGVPPLGGGLVAASLSR